MSSIYAQSSGATTVGGGRGTPAADAQRLVRNANLIARNFPQFADDPAMLLRLAGVPMESGALASQIGQLAAARVATGDVEDLRGMSDESQRILWDTFTSGQQQGYVQMGYELPNRKQEGSDIWGADALGSVFEPLGAAWGAVGSVAQPVIGAGLTALTEVSEIAPEMYRMIRQQPEWVQALAGIVAVGGAVALTAATGGAALPGLAAIGGAAATTGGLGVAGASLAGLTAGYTLAGVVAMTSGDTGYWGRTFDDKWSADGEGVFERGALVDATDLLQDDGSILDLASSLALSPQESHGDTSPVARLLREFASRRSATSDQARAAAIEELAGRTGALVGSKEYIESYSALEELSRQPRFMEALSHLERSKISFGRDVGDSLHLPKDSSLYNLVSGGADAMFLLTVDPIFAAGKVLAAERAMRFGIVAKDMSSFAEYGKRIDVLATKPAVQRSWGKIAEYMGRDDAASMVREMPNTAGIVMPLKEFAVQRKLGLAKDVEFSWSPGEVTEFFKAQAGYKALGSGRSMAGTANHLIMVPHMTPLQAGFLRTRQELKALAGALDDQNIAFRYTLPPGIGPEYEAGARLASPGMVDPELPFGAGLVLQFVNHVPVLKQVAESAGTFMTTMLTKVPSSGALELGSKLAAGGTQDIQAFTDLGRLFGMPSTVRTKWANMLINAENPSARRAAIGSFYRTIFEHIGVANTPEGVAHVEKFITQATTKAYVLGRPVGTFLGDAAQYLAIPNIVELRKAVKSQTVLNKLLNLTDADLINTAVTKIWKPSVLLRLGFISRAVGDEMISWLARDGLYGVVAGTLGRAAVRGEEEIVGHAKWVAGLHKVMHGGKNHLLTKFGRAAEEFNPKMIRQYSEFIRTYYRNGLLNSRFDKLEGGFGRAVRAIATPDHRLRTLALNGVPEHYIRAGRIWFDQPLIRGAIMHEASATKTGVAHDIASPDPYRDNNLYRSDNWMEAEIADQMRLSNEWEIVDPRSSRFDYHAWKNQNRVNETDGFFDADDLAVLLTSHLDPATVANLGRAGYEGEDLDTVLDQAAAIIRDLDGYTAHPLLAGIAKDDPDYMLGIEGKRRAEAAAREAADAQMRIEMGLPPKVKPKNAKPDWRENAYDELARTRDVRAFWAALIDEKNAPLEIQRIAELATRIIDNGTAAERGWLGLWLDLQRTSPGTGILTDWDEASRDALIGEVFGNHIRNSAHNMETWLGLEDSGVTARTGRRVARPSEVGTQKRYVPTPTVGGVEALEHIARAEMSAIQAEAAAAARGVSGPIASAVPPAEILGQLEAIADAPTIAIIKRMASEFAGYPPHIVDLVGGGLHRPLWWSFRDPVQAREVTAVLNELAGFERVDMAAAFGEITMPVSLSANAHVTGMWDAERGAEGVVRLAPETMQRVYAIRPGEGLVSVNGELIPGASEAEALLEHLEVKTQAFKSWFHSPTDKGTAPMEGPKVIRRARPPADPDQPHWMPEDADYYVKGKQVSIDHLDGILDDGGDPFVILPDGETKGARAIVDPFGMERDFNQGGAFIKGETPAAYGEGEGYEFVLDHPDTVQLGNVVLEDEIIHQASGKLAPGHQILDMDPGPIPASEQWEQALLPDTHTVYVYPTGHRGPIEEFAEPDQVADAVEDLTRVRDLMTDAERARLDEAIEATGHGEGWPGYTDLQREFDFGALERGEDFGHAEYYEAQAMNELVAHISDMSKKYLKAGPAMDFPFDTEIALMDEGIRVLRVVEPQDYETTLGNVEDFIVRMDPKTTQTYVDPLAHEVVVPIAYGRGNQPVVKVVPPPGVSPRSITDKMTDVEIEAYVRARALASQRIYGKQLGGDVRLHTDKLIEDMVDQMIGLPWGRTAKIEAGVSRESTEFSTALNELGITGDEVLSHLSPDATSDDFIAGVADGSARYREMITDYVALRAGGATPQEGVVAALRRVGYALPSDAASDVSRVLWESVGPMALDKRWKSRGWNVADEEGLPLKFADPGDMRHVPEADRPRGIVRPKQRVVEAPGWWDKMVQFGFGKVIGPMIDKLMRTPFAFNNFATAYRDVERNHAWLRDPHIFAGPASRRVVDVYASRVIRPWSPGDRAVLAGLSTSHGVGPYGRLLEFSSGEPWFTVYGHPSQWLRTHFDQAQMLLRAERENHLLAMLENIEITTTQATRGATLLAPMEGEGVFHHAVRDTMDMATSPFKRMKQSTAAKLERRMMDDGIIVPGETYFTGVGRLRADADSFMFNMSPEHWRQHYARWAEAPPSTVEKGIEELLDAGDNLPMWARQAFEDEPWKMGTLERARANADKAKEATTTLAVERTIADTLPFIDRDNVRSQWQQYVKNIFPFWFAEDQFIRRTLRTVINNPEGIRKAQLLYQGLRSGGVVQTDEYGQDVFVYPGSTVLAEVVAKLPWLRDAAPIASAMTGQVLYSLPGLDRFAVPQVSPLISIPMSQITAMFPEMAPLHEALSGQRGAGLGVIRSIVPTSVMRFYDAILSDDGDRKLASAMMSALAVMEANGQGLPDDATVDEVEHHIDRARQLARSILLTQAIVGFVGPASPQARFVGTPGQPGKAGNAWDWGNLIGTSAIDVMLNDEYVQMVQNLGAEEGTLAFLARYPDSTPEDLFNSNLVYKIGKSKSVAGAPIPPTQAANEWLNENREWVEMHPHAGAWMVPPARTQEEAEERDTATWMEQITLGLRVNKAPDEFLRDIKFGVASERYFGVREEMQKAIDESTDAERRADMNVQMSLWTTAYLATHPIFAEELQSSEGRIRRAKVLADLRLSLLDPQAPKAWHLGYLQQMIENFDEYQAAKAALTGKRDKRSMRKREDLQGMFVAWADEWVTTHPELRTFWLGIIRPEADLT